MTENPTLTSEELDEIRSQTLAKLTAKARARRAKPEASVPAGYKLVPVEPTDHMLQRGQEQAVDCTDDFTARSACVAEHVWEAMLSASPEPKPSGEDG